MPIKREYKCQIIFQTAANVTQIAKIQQQQKRHPKKIRVTAQEQPQLQNAKQKEEEAEAEGKKQHFCGTCS